MLIFTIGIYFIFWICIGSFLRRKADTIAIKYDGAWIKPYLQRSECDHCHQKLTWFELIPLFSRLVLWGRCGSCKEKLSPSYPLSELFAWLVFAVYWWWVRFMPLPLQLLWSTIIALCVFLSFYDLLKQELEWRWFILLLLSIIAFYSLFYHVYGLDSTLVLASTFVWGAWWLLIRWVWLIIWRIKSWKRMQWFGFGDVLMGAVLWSLLQIVWRIWAYHHMGDGTVSILTFGLWSIELLFFHMLLSSILGIVWYLWRSDNYGVPFIPYMLSGFLLLAIVIIMFSDYFLSLVW